jgi:hypothetical protein
MVGDLRRATHRAIQAARAQVGQRSASAPASNSVRVHLTVESNLVDDITDLLRQVEGRAVRNGAVVTVPFPPGRDPARAVTEVQRVLNWWGDKHPEVSAVVLPSEEGDQGIAAAAGSAAGRGILAVRTVAQRLGSRLATKRSASTIRRPALGLQRPTSRISQNPVSRQVARLLRRRASKPSA